MGEAQDRRPLPLGPFDLLDELGRGGMGRVWRARHRVQDASVAVKILHAARVDDAAFRRAFDAEVQSIVALDHPGIVLVHDHGLIPAETAEASDGKVVEGSPYLVMELARGGSLADLPMPMQWPGLRAALRSLLDALAHAHARGVVHRDIKRSNVLIGLAGDSRPGLKLSDFGLVHRLSDLSGVRGFEKEAVGTPNYMAPEQVQARWRDYGPWTDLYALGCLAWSLATGGPPFRGTPVEVMAAHVRSPLPTFHPPNPMPDEFEGWLRRMLAKKEWNRFACAADAAFALDAVAGGSSAVQGVPLQLTYPDGERTAVDVSTRSWTIPPLPVSGLTEDVEEAPLAQFRPAFPADWRPPREVPAAPRLLGVGLGLFGLRRARFVAREEERDRLWGELQRVESENRASVVLLEGAPGQGKSRLARWLCERAHELGLARVIRVVHGPGAGPRAGLEPAVERHLGLRGLDRDASLGRIGRLLKRLDCWDAELVVELTELVRPRSPDAVGRSRGSRGRHHIALLRLLEALARRRPVILWIEDLAWSADGAAFVETLLARQTRSPSAILVAATVRPAESDATAADDLDRLAGRADCARMTVGPLPEAAQEELIGDLLGLAPTLATYVRERAAGNPLFAVLLVGDWVQRGLLQPGPEGFELTSEAAPEELPDGLHELWLHRVDVTLSALSGTPLSSLEVAATLGDTVRHEEWGAVLEAADLDLDEELARALVRGGLARQVEEGWEFGHGMLRESLLRRAREAGRSERWHRACALALTDLPAPDPALRAKRLGRHWYAAGDWQACVEPLLAAAELRRRAGDCAAALGAVQIAEAAMKRGGAEPGTRMAVRVAVARADTLSAAGRVSEAGAVAGDVIGFAHNAGWSELEAAARVHSAMARMREHEFEEALVVLEQALTLYLVAENGAGMVEAGRLLARCLGACGRLEEALVRGRAALAAADALGDPSARAEVLLVLGGLQKRAGRLEDAERLCSGAAGILARAGHHARVAEAWLIVADVRRRRGDLDGAHALLERSRATWAEAGSLYVGTVDINLGLIDVECGRFLEAVDRLTEAIAAADLEGDKFVAFAGRVLCVQAFAAVDRWARVAALLDELASLDVALASAETAAAQEDAGDRAARADQRELAVRCWTQTLRQWQRLGLRGPSLRVSVKLEEISPSD